MKTNFVVLLACGFLFHSSALAEEPSWYDVKAHIRKLQHSHKADGKIGLENLTTQKVDIGDHKLVMVTARYGAGKSESGGGFNVTEVYGEPPVPGKVLFSITDKTGCDSKVGEELVAKKLGYIGDTQVYFAQVRLVAPSCPKSEITSPKVFLVLQEKKNSLEKVYESSISENGKYRINFKKEMIYLEYAKSLDSDDLSVTLTWDEQAQKFVEESN